MKVSILIPCYNAEHWIGEAIRSSLAQTHSDKEVIVLDDGSTDGSLEIIQSFVPSIKWESTKNLGGNHARNQLLNLATGEWIQYLDGDDYLREDKIAQQLSEGCPIEDHDVLFSPVIEETWIGDRRTSTRKHTFDSNTDLYRLWLQWRVAQTGTVLWRKTALTAIGGWNEDVTICQDNEVTKRAIQARLRFQFTPSANAVYRVWSDETVCRRDPEALCRAKTALLDEMLGWLDDHGLMRSAHEKEVGVASFEMARQLAAHRLASASAYYRERKAKGLMRPTNPAAPVSYRFILSMLGFRFTESLAARLRHQS